MKEAVIVVDMIHDFVTHPSPPCAHRCSIYDGGVETRVQEPLRTASSAPTGTSKTSTSVEVPVGLPAGTPSGNRPKKSGDDMVDGPVAGIGERGFWGAA